jgi:hypothetical protein
MLRRGGEGDGSTELQVPSTQSNCYSEVTSAHDAAAAAAALQQRAHTLTGARPAAMLRRGVEGVGCSELKLKSTRSDCYSSKASSAPDVAAAMQQRSVHTLTGARPSAMLRRGDNAHNQHVLTTIKSKFIMK